MFDHWRVNRVNRIDTWARKLGHIEPTDGHGIWLFGDRYRFPSLQKDRNFGHVHCGWSTPVMVSCLLPSGKHTKNYGKSPFSMGKPPINGPFSMAMLNYQRVTQVLSFINPSLKLEWTLHQLRKRTGAPTVMIIFWGTNFSSYTSYDCGYHLGTRVLTHNHVCSTNLANFNQLS